MSSTLKSGDKFCVTINMDPCEKAPAKKTRFAGGKKKARSKSRKNSSCAVKSKTPPKTFCQLVYEMNEYDDLISGDPVIVLHPEVPTHLDKQEAYLRKYLQPKVKHRKMKRSKVQKRKLVAEENGHKSSTFVSF